MKTKDIIEIHNEFQTLINTFSVENHIKAECFNMLEGYKNYYDKERANVYLAENIYLKLARENEQDYNSFNLNSSFYFGEKIILKSWFRAEIKENKVILYYRELKVKEYKRGEV